MNSVEVMRGVRVGVAVSSGSREMAGPSWVRGFEEESLSGGGGGDLERWVEFEPMGNDPEVLFAC